MIVFHPAGGRLEGVAKAGGAPLPNPAGEMEPLGDGLLERAGQPEVPGDVVEDFAGQFPDVIGRSKMMDG